MRTSPQRVRFWLLLILLCGLSAQAADTRLGLVTLGGKTDDLADLLTAELSKLPGVELVERRELRRIMEEQGLSSMTSANAVKLGKLARADALLLMDPGATNVVQIRLVSPVAGAVLRNTPVTWPATNTTEIAGTLAKLLQRDMERLANLSSNATLVTIAGFKAALKGSAGAGAEERISRMLALRLSAETNLIVLERRSFDALSFDRETAAAGPLTGSVVVDGTFDPDGIKPGQLTVRMRVVPVGAAPQTIDLAAASSDEPGLVEEMAGKLLAALQRQPQGRWDPKAEAERLYEEAQWAGKWGSVSEMRSAIEAAWALGMQNQEIAVARLEAAVNSLPDMGSGPSGNVDRINRALDIQRQMAKQLFGDDHAFSQRWQEFSVKLSAEALLRLRFFYRNPDQGLGLESALASIRAAIRDLMWDNMAYPGAFDLGTRTWTGTFRSVPLTGMFRGRPLGPGSTTRASMSGALETFVAFGFWSQDTIASSVQHWEWILRQAELDDIVRWTLLHPDILESFARRPAFPMSQSSASSQEYLPPPPLVEWRPFDANLRTAEWIKLCDRLLGEEDSRVVIRTARLALQTSNSPPRIRFIFRRTLDAILQDAPERIADGSIEKMLENLADLARLAPESIRPDVDPLPDWAAKRLEEAKLLAVPIAERLKEEAKRIRASRLLALMKSKSPDLRRLTEEIVPRPSLWPMKTGLSDFTYSELSAMRVAASRLLAKIEVQGVTNRNLQTFPVTRFLSEIRSQIHNTDEGRRLHLAALLSFLRSQSPDVGSLMAEQAVVDKAGFTLVELRAIQAESSNLLARIEARGMTNRVQQLGPLNGLLAGLRNRIAKIPPPPPVAIPATTPQQSATSLVPSAPVVAARPSMNPSWDTNVMPWAPQADLLRRATNRPPDVAVRFFAPPGLADEQGATASVRIASATLSPRGYLLDCSSEVVWPFPKFAFTNLFGEVGARVEQRRYAWLVSESGATLDLRRLDGSDYSFRFNPVLQNNHLVEVGNHYFYRVGNAIRALSLEDNRDFLVPDMPELYEPSLAGLSDKLAVISGDTIILRRPNNNASELFAGLRRRPPQSPLDLLSGWPPDFSDRIVRAGPGAWAFPVGTNVWRHDFSSGTWTTNGPFSPISTNWIHQYQWEVRGTYLVRRTADGFESEAIRLKDPTFAEIGVRRGSEILRWKVGNSSVLVTFSGARGAWLLTESDLRALFPTNPVRSVAGKAFNPRDLARAGKQALLDDPKSYLQLWDSLDEDRDGFISAREVVWFDLNGNGKFDNAEADAFSRVASSRACELLLRFDWNRDGLLDGDERSALSRALPQLDTWLYVVPGKRGWFFDSHPSNVWEGRRPLETRTEVLARELHFALLLNAVVPSPGSPETKGFPAIVAGFAGPNEPNDEFHRGWFLNAINRVRPDTKPMADARAARLSPAKP